MKKILTRCLIAAGIAALRGDLSTYAGDCFHEGGVSYHGRIVTRIHKTWLGASPAPTAPVFVSHVPAMTAVPFVATPVYSTLPTTAPIPTAPTPAALPAAAAPVPPSPAAPTASVTPGDQQQLVLELRAQIDDLRRNLLGLAMEVRQLRQENPGPQPASEAR